MIHPIKEEIKIIVALIFYGIYLISIYETIIIIEKEYNYKRVIRYIIELIFGIIQIIITYFFSYNLANGYIPGYFIIFMILGIYIYLKFIQDNYTRLLKNYLKIIKKFSSKIKKIIQELFFSKELFVFFGKHLKRYKKIFKKQKK